MYTLVEVAASLETGAAVVVVVDGSVGEDEANGVDSWSSPSAGTAFFSGTDLAPDPADPLAKDVPATPATP
ncbi:hypothetical protein OGATHE_005501, partial [Ogataea polymorpha]